MVFPDASRDVLPPVEVTLQEAAAAEAAAPRTAFPAADVSRQDGSATGSRQRLPQLDFLRCIAILLIIGHHMIMPVDEAASLKPVAELWRDWGWTGVDLFFVLSGFLIGGLLFAELRQHGKLNVKRFIIRRGFKIWPLYLGYVAGLVVLIAAREHLSLRQAVLRAWPFYTHTQNYTMHADLYANYPVAHLWSLAVEEHFYLLLPLLLLFLASRSRNAAQAIAFFPPAAVFVLIACLAMRCATFHMPFVPEHAMWPTHLRMDSLAFGVLLAYGWHYKRERLQPLLARPGWLLTGALGLLVLITPSLRVANFNCTVGYTLLYLIYGSILLACMASTLPEQQSGRVAAFFRFPASRFIAGIGFWSYSIYIIHLGAGKLPSKWFLHQNLPLHHSVKWLIVMALYVTTSVLLGTLCGRLIEKPTLALRNRLFPA